MGVCSNKRRWYRHAARAQIPDGFAGDLIQVCGPGIDYVLRNEPDLSNKGMGDRGGDNSYYGRGNGRGAGSGAGGGIGNGGGSTRGGNGGYDGMQMYKEAPNQNGSPGKR